MTPPILLSWYYNSDDIEKLTGSDLPNYIGKHELFETNATQTADIHCIVAPA